MLYSRALILLVCPLLAFSESGATVRLTAAQQEEFLRTAKPVRSTVLSVGVTGSKRLSLFKDGFQHDAQFQPVDKLYPSLPTASGTELNLKDCFKYNVAAYELAKTLGIADMMPVSIQRSVGGTTGALTWWIDEVQMSEAKRQAKGIQPPDLEHWNREMAVIRVFDQLIDNTDRNLNNILISKDWNAWMIDHTRAFRLEKKLRREENLTRCDRALLANIRELDKAGLKTQLGRYLTNTEMDALLARRDLIVAKFEDLVKQKGEAAVLFERSKRN